MSKARIAWSLLAVALALVAVRQVVRWGQHVGSGPAAKAKWIWAPARGEAGAPTAFFAVKDFRLSFRPREAELRILADEEYHVVVNDHGLGAGRYRLGAPLDAYPVGNALRRGDNRILVELRSARGAGGLLVRLEIEGRDGEKEAIVSDDTWRIARRYSPAALAPDSRLAEKPVVWGPQPTGRWGSPAVAPALTLRRLQLGLPERQRSPRPAERLRRSEGSWEPAPRHGEGPLGPWVTFDFGEVRTGYLNLRFAADGGTTGFAFYGVRQPKDGIDRPDEAILRPPGRRQWTASSPTRFRFVTVVGAPEVSAAEVVPVDPELAAPRLERSDEEGLFGIERRRILVAPVEDEVRSELEGVPGFTGRKDG